MSIQESALRLPWYRSLNRGQWKVLIASNLGWTFDGFEIFALFLTVGSRCGSCSMPRNTRPSRNMPATSWPHRVRLGGGRRHRRHHRRLHRPQAHDDAGDPRLFADHRAQRTVAWDWESFAVLALPGRASRSARNGRPAPRSSPSCGPTTHAAKAAGCCNAAPGSAAFSPRCLAVDRLERPRRLALDVSGRGVAGVCRVVDPPQHPGIAALGRGERTPPRSA